MFHFPFHETSFVLIINRMGPKFPLLLSCRVQNEAVHCKLQILLMAWVFLLPLHEGVFSDAVLLWDLAEVGYSW